MGVKKAEYSAPHEIQEPPEHHKKILDATFKGSSDDVDSSGILQALRLCVLFFSYVFSL